MVFYLRTTDIKHFKTFEVKYLVFIDKVKDKRILSVLLTSNDSWSNVLTPKVFNEYVTKMAIVTFKILG